jgi:hypothetical protein
MRAVRQLLVQAVRPICAGADLAELQYRYAADLCRTLQQVPGEKNARYFQEPTALVSSTPAQQMVVTACTLGMYVVLAVSKLCGFAVEVFKAIFDPNYEPWHAPSPLVVPSGVHQQHQPYVGVQQQPYVEVQQEQQQQQQPFVGLEQYSFTHRPGLGYSSSPPRAHWPSMTPYQGHGRAFGYYQCPQC